MAEALNLIDDARPEREREAFELLDTLERQAPSPGAARVGLTGAPGAGKSTLLDALVRRLRARDETVGIIAIDPSSQRTGGALLGDRLRVRSGAADPGVFIRSMAARTRLGGLADATRAGVRILATVFDWLFVETVGVGQSEGEVASLVDTLLYVAQPGAGDMLQFMKAGVLELPDLFVVNKADLGPVAERTANELQSGLGLGEAGLADWRAPVLLVSARDGEGIEELVQTLDRHREHLAASGDLLRRRQRGERAGVIAALERRYGSYGLEQVGGADGVAQRLAAASDESSIALARALGAEIEDALRKTRP